MKNLGSIAVALKSYKVLFIKKKKRLFGCIVSEKVMFGLIVSEQVMFGLIVSE